MTRQIAEDAARRRERDFPSATPSPTPVTTTPTSTPTQTPSPGRQLAVVRRVLDGNTVLLDGGNVVRYIGVDTPGAGMFRRPVEPFGREAAERNVDLVEGRIVELEPDVTDVDASGELLRYVYVDGVMVNETLLREGLARAAPARPNTKYASLFQDDEAYARQIMVNIWTLITATPTPTRPPTDTRPPTNTPRPTPTPLPVAPGVGLVQAVLDSPIPTAVPTAPPTSTLPTTPTPRGTPTAVRLLNGVPATRPPVVLVTFTPVR